MLGRPPATTAHQPTTTAPLAATAAPPPATPKPSPRRLLGEAFIIGLATTAEHAAAGALVVASRAPRLYGGAALARRGAAWRARAARRLPRTAARAREPDDLGRSRAAPPARSAARPCSRAGRYRLRAGVARHRSGAAGPAPAGAALGTRARHWGSPSRRPTPHCDPRAPRSVAPDADGKRRAPREGHAGDPASRPAPRSRRERRYRGRERRREPRRSPGACGRSREARAPAEDAMRRRELPPLGVGRRPRAR